MNEHIVVRGIAGPLNGEVRRLSGGDTWRIGTPPILLLTVLGEGRVRMDPMRAGVRSESRDIHAAETLELGATPTTLSLPDGSTLWLTRAKATARPAAGAVHELRLGDALPSPRATSRWRAPRSPLRLLRASLPWRVSRSVAVSIAVHGAVALALFLLLMLTPREVDEERHALRVAFGGDTVDVPPEAVEGTPQPDEPKAGDDGDDPARSAAHDTDDLAAALDAEAGKAADRTRDADAIGVSSAPSGQLLAARHGGRQRLLAAGGGVAATDGALTRALEWLARHQGLDGTWDARAFGGSCRSQDHCTGVGDRAYAEATTALALLPFLGAGHTHLEGRWRETIRDGLAALVRLQRDDGSFAMDSKRAYASAMAALVLAEAYGLTGSETLREPARRAARYFVARQSEQGGWRYQPGDGKSDTSVTGWVTLALVAAHRAGLDVPARTLDGCRRWLVGRTSPDGLVGYIGLGRGTDALLGVGLFGRHLLGADATGPDLEPVARRLAGLRPEWPRDLGPTGYGVSDPMHWYYGSLAAFQAGGDAWLMWEPRLRAILLERQAAAGCEAGSWPAVGSTGSHGGRVVATALCALCLEVTYRYPRATFGR